MGLRILSPDGLVRGPLLLLDSSEQVLGGVNKLGFAAVRFPKFLPVASLIPILLY